MATTPSKYVRSKTEVHSFDIIQYPGSYQVRWCTYVAPRILLCRLHWLQVKKMDTALRYMRVVTIVLPQISKIMIRKPATTEEGQLQSFDNSEHFYAFNKTHAFPIVRACRWSLNAWNLSQMNPLKVSPTFLKKFIKTLSSHLRIPSGFFPISCNYERC